MKFLSQTSKDIFKDKVVLVRLDLNVPVQDDGSILPTDTNRIEQSKMTLDWLMDAGAKIRILSHIGRDPKDSLEPVARYLSIPLVGHDAVLRDITEPVVIIENVRQDIREEQNDKTFAELFANQADYFVFDAFAVAHRTHASVVGISKLIPCFGGFQLEQEIHFLSQVFDAPTPSTLILGGAKFDTKLAIIEKFIDRVETIIIGGALAHTFYRARGYEIGRSLIDDRQIADELLHHPKILVPDWVIVENAQGRFEKRADEVLYDEKIVDMGPKSFETIGPLLQQSAFVLWNGPLGNYENGCIEGSKKLIEILDQTDAIKIAGGGDSVALIEQLDAEKSFSFLSTGGGAMLEYLAQGTLPGIEALE